MRPLLLIPALLFAPDGDREKGKDSPLRPLCAVAKHLEKGMADYLKGTAPAEAWKPWEVADERRVPLRDAALAAGTATAPSFALDLYVSFVKGGVHVYRVQAIVHVTPARAALFGLRGDDVAGGPRGIAASACRDQTAPFGEAATALAKALKGGRAEKLPSVSDDAVVKILSDKVRPEFLASLEEMKKRAPEVASRIAALDYDEIWVDADNGSFCALGADGAPLSGMIRSKLKLKEGGLVAFRLGRYDAR